MAWRYLSYHRVRTGLLVLALTITIALPLVVDVLTSRYEAALRTRAAATPLVLGAKGSRFDLIMSSLYLRIVDLETVPYREGAAIAADGLADVIPLHIRFAARGRPIVGTSPGYFAFRELAFEAGHAPRRLGDCVVGAAAARDLGVRVGGFVLTDPENVYDLAASYPLRMRVTGVLAASGTSDDHAVFTAIKTTWLIEGHLHGHTDLGEGRAEGEHVVANASVVTYQEVTDENLASFHLHGDKGHLPVSGFVVLPRTPKARTIVRSRVNLAANSTVRLVDPAEVVEEIMRIVLRIQRFVKVVAFVLGFATGLLVLLLIGLSLRMREAEFKTLHRLGCSRLAVVRLLVTEWLLILLASGALIALAVWLASWLAPELSRL
jgi:putative ABC transport system permease protein